MHDACIRCMRAMPDGLMQQQGYSHEDGPARLLPEERGLPSLVVHSRGCRSTAVPVDLACASHAPASKGGLASATITRAEKTEKRHTKFSSAIPAANKCADIIKNKL